MVGSDDQRRMDGIALTLALEPTPEVRTGRVQTCSAMASRCQQPRTPRMPVHEPDQKPVHELNSAG